jgi:hypothetical protein
MESNKKAEGLSLSVIVIAIVALVVLIVLILIFSGKIGDFNKEVSSCPAGTTATNPSTEGGCPGGAIPRGFIGTGANKQYCCPPSESSP